MKKVLSLLLALVMCLSLAACGSNDTNGNSSTEQQRENNSEQQESSNVITKEEMISNAQPLTQDEIDKSWTNAAFAKSLIGNTYTFVGEISLIKEDHAVINSFFFEEYNTFTTGGIDANVYLPLDELISLENQQKVSFVGILDDVISYEETVPVGQDSMTVTSTAMVFKSAAIVSDRFEATGILVNEDTAGSWFIKKSPDSDHLFKVHFRDDVSAYEGQEITYSYKDIGDSWVDAYIVE